MIWIFITVFCIFYFIFNDDRVQVSLFLGFPAALVIWGLVNAIFIVEKETKVETTRTEIVSLKDQSTERSGFYMSYTDVGYKAFVHNSDGSYQRILMSGYSRIVEDPEFTNTGTYRVDRDCKREKWLRFLSIAYGDWSCRSWHPKTTIYVPVGTIVRGFRIE